MLPKWVNRILQGSLKWSLIAHFTAISFLYFIVLTAGRSIVHEWVGQPSQPSWMEMVFGLILCSAVFGYIAGQSIQRKIDALHLAILQLTKGNLSARVPLKQTGTPFYRIYRDFNEMAASLEGRVKLLQKLGEENALKEKTLTEAAVMEERKRLARDLHDSVSQQLFAIHMSASTLEQLLSNGEEHRSDGGESRKANAGVIARQLAEVSSAAQIQIRRLIHQLRPLELQGKSLSEALHQWFPDFCRQNHLQGQLRVDLREPLPEGMEHQIFLVIQEGLANVAKHASARKVQLTLLDAGHKYVLHIIDDGKGFDTGKTGLSSYGTMTMRERAQKLGGELQIFSKPGAGTKIEVNIPKFFGEGAIRHGRN